MTAALGGDADAQTPTRLVDVSVTTDKADSEAADERLGDAVKKVTGGGIANDYGATDNGNG